MDPKGSTEILQKILSPCKIQINLVPRAFPLKVGGAGKALASAGHVSILHPEILGVIN